MKKINIVFLTLYTLTLNAAWIPTPPISPGAASVNSSGSPLIIDSNSVALVGWLNGQFVSAQDSSSASLSPLSNTWTAPQTVFTNTSTATFPSAPILSEDALGNQLAVFGVIDGMTSSIVLNGSRRPANTIPWLPPITQNISAVPNGAGIASDSLGNFGVLFPLSTGGTIFNIELAQLLAGSPSWEPLVPFFPSPDTGSNPAVAGAAYQGNAVFAWKTTPPLQVNTARFNYATQTMSDLFTVPLPPLTTDIRALFLAVDAHGDAILLLAVNFGSQTMLYSSTLLTTGTWSAPLLISDPMKGADSAAIASDAVGTATIIWGESSSFPNQQLIRAATLPLGGAPVSATLATAAIPPFNSEVSVAVDSFGNAAAAWGISSAGTEIIQVSSKSAGGNWLAPTPLSASGNSPFVVLSDQETAVATWVDGGTNRLMGSRNLTLFPLQPPSKFIGVLNVTGDKIIMTWKPSPVPNVTYEIYKNNQLIATIPGSGPFRYVQPTSRNDSRNYKLRAVASNGSKSVFIPIKIMKKCWQW